MAAGAVKLALMVSLSQHGEGLVLRRRQKNTTFRLNLHGESPYYSTTKFVCGPSLENLNAIVIQQPTPISDLIIYS